MIPALDSWSAHAGSAALHPYDGTWRVLLRHESIDPDCVALELAATLRVEGSEVSGLFNHASTGVYEVHGEITSHGASLIVAYGVNTNNFTGLFQDDQGSGRWKSRIFFCKGSWVAERESVGQ